MKQNLERKGVNNMNQPFRDFEMCCPHCGSTHFVKTDKCFSPFSRWTCQGCHGKFFRSVQIQLMTERVYRDKVERITTVREGG